MTVLGRPNFFGGTLQATASGAIADGDPVILNADGTVSAVSLIPTLVAAVGEKMYLPEYTARDGINEYDLSTAFDISTTTATGTFFDVSAQDTYPMDIRFSTDMTKMFVLGRTQERIFEYALSTAGDLSTATYTGASLSLTAQDTDPFGLTFNGDGTKLFMVGYGGDRVYEYTLSSAFDLSTATYSGTSFSVAAQEIGPLGVTFSPDGTNMYIVGYGSDTIYQYTLSTGFDISTASYSGNSVSVAAQSSSPRGMALNTDGTEIFFLGPSGDVFQYTMSTAYDLSTATYTQTVSVAATQSTTGGIAFNTAAIYSYATNLTDADTYIGIANGAYADGTTATIQLVGSTDDAQSGLTAGEIYYVQTDGSLSTTPDTPEVEAGYAISPTEIVVKGAYSKVTATVPEYQPTPLADATPRIFGIQSNLYLYEGTSARYKNTSNFWNMVDLQGAYIIDIAPTAYTEIVSATGPGWLGTIIIGGARLALHETFIEVTIDAEVREFKILQLAGWNAIIDFSPINLLERSSVTHAFAASDSVGAFSSPYTTAYSTMYSRASTSTDSLVLQPTVLTGGLRFKSNMRVRIKSASSFGTTGLADRHGVLYVLDS